MVKYFTLIERHEGTWGIEFGDYQRSVVRQEMMDRHHSDPYPALRDMRIVNTADDSQAAIDALLREINEAEHAKAS